jgi:hypothetical protein
LPNSGGLGRWEKIMDEIRAVVAEMESEEHRLLNEHSDESSSRAAHDCRHCGG